MILHHHRTYFGAWLWKRAWRDSWPDAFIERGGPKKWRVITP